jgi:rhombotail lipoprotein
MKRLVLLALVLAISSACASGTVQHRAGVLDYLYPQGATATPATDVHLALPLRIGVAFAPGDESELRGSSGNFWTGDLGGMYRPMLDASEKQRLLERVVAAFQGVEGVQSIQIIPASYLKPQGGFENVDQLRGLLGIDLVALLSFEQTQFQDYNKGSLSYLTLVGGYFIEGNENETHTFVDTSVFDIPSRALLFNAGGRSRVTESSTALEASENLRNDSSKGFDQAIDAMIVELKKAVDAFRVQAKSGTVRGAGTPNLAVSGGGGGGVGAGAAGALELAFALLCAAGAWLGRRAPAA